MSANFPRRLRPAASQELAQRSDDGEAHLWHLGTVLTVSFTVAGAGLAGLAWLAWILLGLAGYRHHGTPALKDTIGVLQLVFASVAGAGALVALIVAYRRQKIAEADSSHDRIRVFNERFTTVAAQLGDAQPAVRLAGVHAMAGLADDWKQNRQTCVDVLCAYLRLPHDPEPGDDAAHAERTAYQANREVRHTIIRLIGAHLRPGAVVSWQGLNLDFTGVVFDGGDFTAVQFSSGTVLFTRAVFSGGEVDFGRAVFSGGKVDFGRAVFSGGKVDFGDAMFSGGHVRFFRAAFSGGRVSFHNALFNDGLVDFLNAVFSGGEVDFGGAVFSGGKVAFLASKFSGARIDFSHARFDGAEVNFGRTDEISSPFKAAEFSGGQVSFADTEFSSGRVNFVGVAFSGGQVSFVDVTVSGGQVSFAEAIWIRPPTFSWGKEPPAGVTLPAIRIRINEGN